MTATQQQFPNISAPMVDPRTGLINQIWYQFLITLWTRTGQSQGSAANSSGTVSPYAGETLPAGWLLCDGSAVARTSYPNLFSAIGVTWGVGDGVNTFNLPNLSARFLIGTDGISSFDLGDTGGASTVSLATANLPSHNHAVTDPGHTHAVTDPGHTHGITDPGHTHTALVAASTNTAGAAAGDSTAGSTGSSVTGISVNLATTGVSANSNTTGVTTQNTGSGDAVNILPRYAAIQWMIKT